MLLVMTQSGQPSWEALAGVTNELESHKKEKNSSEIPLKTTRHELTISVPRSTFQLVTFQC